MLVHGSLLARILANLGVHEIEAGSEEVQSTRTQTARYEGLSLFDEWEFFAIGGNR